MSNVLERYFEAASRRIPPQPPFFDEDLPQPVHPESEGFDPNGLGGDNDELIPVEERWRREEISNRLGDPLPFSITDDDRDLLDGGIREVGLDVYAFYKSRRHISANPYRGKWGIFYLEHGVARINELIEATYPGYGPTSRLAHQFLRQHERYHYKFDLYALSVESSMARSLYEPLKRAFSKHRVFQLEEALANRDAWEWSKRDRVSLNEFAYDFMKLQPGAYAWFDRPRFALVSELAANLLDLNLARHARRDDQALWVAVVPDELLRPSLCPEYFVRPATLSAWISPIWSLPRVLSISDGPSLTKLLKSKYISLRQRWEETKKKLIACRELPSLQFKRWDKLHWSVRVNDNFRAHLHPISESRGEWEADDFGPHTAMGHG